MDFKKFAAACAAAVLVGAGAAACSSEEEPDSSVEQQTSANGPNPTRAAEEPAESEEPETESEHCDDPQLDLAETELGYWLGGGRFPTSNSDDFFYHVEDIDNQFDPCADLSWVKLTGAFGDMGRPAGTGASLADYVVLFSKDQLVKDPLPFGAERVDDVERLSDQQIKVSYASRAEGEPTAARPSVIDVATYTASNPGSVTVEVDGEPSYAADRITFDFATNPPPGDPVSSVFGNANYKPWTHEVDHDSTVSIKTGQMDLVCGFDGSGVFCADNGGDGVNWTSDDGASAHEVHFRLGMGPDAMFSSAGAPVLSPELSLADGDLVKSGGHFMLVWRAILSSRRAPALPSS